jgi:hypothetical protein
MGGLTIPRKAGYSADADVNLAENLARLCRRLMLDVSYAGSALVGQAGVPAERSFPGERFPGRCRLKGTGHHLIVFGGTPRLDHLRAQWGALVSIVDASNVEFDPAEEMRTSLTLDDDFAGLLKQRALEFGIPFKEVVNREIRAGVGEAGAARRDPAPKTISHSFGLRPSIDLHKLGQLAQKPQVDVVVHLSRPSGGELTSMKRRLSVVAPR